MSPTIREATAGDAPAIDALFAEGDAFHAAGAPGSFRATTAPARQSSTRRRSPPRMSASSLRSKTA